MTHTLPTQIGRQIKKFVHKGNQNDIEQIILAIENLISRNKKFILTLDQGEEFRFSFLPKKPKILGDGTEMNGTKIDLYFNPYDVDVASIHSFAYPFLKKSKEEIEDQKKWIVFLIYDILQQFGVSLDWDSNENIIRTANANIGQKAFSDLLKSRRTAYKESIPRWYSGFKKLLHLIRASESESI